MYLTHNTYGEFCGRIGDITNIQTNVNGITLAVGDVVYVKNKQTGKTYTEIIRWSETYKRFIINGFGHSTAFNLEMFLSTFEVRLAKSHDSEFIKDTDPYKIAKFKSVKKMPYRTNFNDHMEQKESKFEQTKTNIVLAVNKCDNRPDLRSLLIKHLYELDKEI